MLTQTEIVSHECQDEEELYKPEKYVCHICKAFFFTKPMLKRHEELHNKGIIYLAGQSVVPVSWIGRQTTMKKKPTPENCPIRKKAKPTVILEQQKKQSFTGEEDRRSSQSRLQNRREVTVHIREPTLVCPFEEHLQDDSSRSSSSLNSPCRVTSDTVVSPGVAEKQNSIPRDIGQHLEYYDGDKRLPILMRECKGVKTREALNFIINEDNLDKENISTIVPTTINQNVSFLVDTKIIGSWKNLLSDDMGTWKTTCVANRFYKWDEKGDLISTPSRQPECFIVYRHQYVNLSSPDLHRVIIRTGTSPEKMMNTVFVQYYFEDEEHAVLVHPHGNRKQDNKPYKRTQETVKNTIRELNMNKRPKDVFHTILERTGGIENLTSGSQKPRDMQQVYNLKRKESNDEILKTIDLLQQKKLNS
ncbi:unnamed protein product [Mytilus coruscus]|uniref:C2H2-type domain-containing protein n=1 Tax=Mytilus coruscus TaxID=42192 RepID=A0A6J8E2I5_MYTCO|nr:unnamed protein product [Mytilus coruscus]